MARKLTYAVFALCCTMLPFRGTTAQEFEARHHYYKLIDLGTLGGPNSFANGGFQPPFSRVLNDKGQVVAMEETLTADPFSPACFNFPECVVGYATRADAHKTTNLGVLVNGS